MQNERITFTHFLSDLVTNDVQNALPEDFPTLNFFCENWETIKYPYVGLTYLNMGLDLPWKKLTAHIDVVFNNYQTYNCDRVTNELLSKLLLLENYDMYSRSTDVYDYSLTPTVKTASKLFWKPVDYIDIEMPKRSELRINSFLLEIEFV